MPDDLFDEAYSRRPHVFGSEPSPLLLEALEGLQPGDRALDLGCGQGRDSIVLLGHGLRVLAIDASPAGVNFLRSAASQVCEGELEARVGDVADISVWDGMYDIIVSSTCLDHLGPAVGKNVLRHAIDRLRDGGVLYLAVHTRRDPGYTRDGSPISEFSSAIRHYYTPNELLAATIHSLHILRYVDRVETDYDHGPVHQHGMAYLVGRKIDK